MAESSLKGVTIQAAANRIANIVRAYIAAPTHERLIGGAFSTVFREVIAHESSSVLVRDRLHRKKLTFHLMSLFARSGGWHPANPAVKTVRDKLEKTYLQLSRLLTDDSPSFVANYATSPTDSTLFSLFNDRRPTAIVGERGVGKTSLFNFWTSIYGRDLLEKNNITWFRIDATKIYTMWRNGLKPEPTVQDYHRVHLVVVYLIYSGALSYESLGRRNDDIVCSDLFRSIHDKLKLQAGSESYSNVLSRIAGSIKENSTLKPLREKVTYGVVADISNELVAATLSDRTNILRQNVCSLYEILAAHFNEVGIRVVVAVDGADNIGLYRRQQLYARMTMQIARFAEELSAATRLVNVGFMLLTRPETIPDIVRSMGRGRLDYNNTHWGTFRVTKIVPPSLSDILARKIEALASAAVFATDRKSTAEAFCAEQGEESSWETDRALGAVSVGLRSLSSMKEDYIAGIQNSIEVAYKFAIEDSMRHGIRFMPKYNYRDLSERRIVKDLFNNNVRSFIDNFVETYGLREFFHEMDISGSYRQDRMLQYLLLDGRLFLNSQEAWNRRQLEDGMIHRIRRGETFPNIFWFDNSIHTTRGNGGPLTRWHGLTAVRLLQILDFISGRSVAASDVLLFLSDIFEYDTRILKQTFENLVAFGLVSINTIRGQEPTFPPEEFRDYRDIIDITQKGRFYLEFSFIFPAWLYQFALDTPVHNELVKSSMYMRCHRELDEFASRGNYLDAVVFSTSTFAKMIREQHIREVELVKGKSDAIRALFSGLIAHVENFIDYHMALPTAFEPVVVENIRRCVIARGRTDRIGMEQLVTDVTGGFGYDFRTLDPAQTAR